MLVSKNQGAHSFLLVDLAIGTFVRPFYESITYLLSNPLHETIAWD